MITLMPLRASTQTERLLIGLVFRPALVLALIAGTAAALSQTAAAATAGVDDKLLHVTAFLLLGFLADYSLPGAPVIYWRWQAPLLLLYGASIELIQGQLPHRSADLLDLAADAAGLAAYGALRPLLGKLWRPY